MSVFFGFMLGPEAIIKSVAFGLGVAILSDAVVDEILQAGNDGADHGLARGKHLQDDQRKRLPGA